MILIFAFLMIALLVKDTAPLGDNLILRGIAEGLCLFVGLWWTVTHINSPAYRKYAIFALYVGSLFLTIFESREPIQVLLQVLSLIAVTLFFFALIEHKPGKLFVHQGAFQTVTYVLIPVCLGSLLLYRLAPNAAIDHTVEGFSAENFMRFTGLFGKPGAMATAAGLLVGLSLFANISLITRLIGLAAAAPCLYLTGSRTFWVATLVASLITAMFHMQNKKTIAALTFVALILGGALVAVNSDIKKGFSSKESIPLRTESIENMSGRTTIWLMALDRFWQRPWLGHGYTMGHHAFLGSTGGRGRNYGEQPDILQFKTFTLHNGYIQALLDSGAIGTMLYFSVIGVALWRIIARDRERQYPGTMYSLVFFAISNGGETVIFSAATFHAVFFWYVALLALSLPGRPSVAHFQAGDRSRTDRYTLSPVGS